MLLTTVAVAVLNAGRWLAECPREYCGNALALDPGQATFHCAGMGGCQLVTEVLWPPDAEQIWAVLLQRPVPGTRNWAPAGHRQALMCGFPLGQTVDDLITENREHGVI